MPQTPSFGPILFSQGCDEHSHRIAAVWATREQTPGVLKPYAAQPAEVIALEALCGHFVWRADFSLSIGQGGFYTLNDRVYRVSTDLAESSSIAYVSCNGKENEDPNWSPAQRNRMWQMLADRHRKQAIDLLLHGGDQLYADDIINAHPVLKAWADAGLEEKSDYPFSAEVESSATAHLFNKYVALYRQEPVAGLLAQIPSLMMWDDHDIMDGWGSHPARMLDSPVGRGLFNVCRRLFMLFQQGQRATTEGTLSLHRHYPGFGVIAPDLRSERRPDSILGPPGWSAMEAALDGMHRSSQVFLMSSVPLLGPRLSWLEYVADWLPGAGKYKDDLRDQWQSRSHRDQWRRMLALLQRKSSERDLAITALSGEIHLATQATMPLGDGATLRQFVASGIVHPPPPTGFARALGFLAALGEDPIPGQAIELAPLPGQKRIYTDQRNFLLLARRGEQWQANWVLESDGPTPAISWRPNQAVKKTNGMSRTAAA